MNEILVTKDGYEQFMDTLNFLEQKLNDNGTNSTEACVSAVGDGWHDNFSFEALVEDARKISYQLSKMNEDKIKLKIIDDKYIKNCVNINDKITIKFIYDDDNDIDEIILTGKYLPNNDEITLNSPLGKAIYKKELGTTLEYTVNDNIIKIQIIDINKIDKN